MEEKRLQCHLFLLGVAKCGTIFLSGQLDQHPDLHMSNPKEPFFFEAEYLRGLRFYQDKYFGGHELSQKTGEARHRNLLLPYVPKRIADSVMAPRFVVFLRDPVERTLSE